MEEKDQNRQKMKRVVDGKMEMKTIKVFMLSKPLFSQTNPKVEVLFSIKVATKCQSNNQNENEKSQKILFKILLAI